MYYPVYDLDFPLFLLFFAYGVKPRDLNFEVKWRGGRDSYISRDFIRGEKSLIRDFEYFHKRGT